MKKRIPLEFVNDTTGRAHARRFVAFWLSVSVVCAVAWYFVLVTVVGRAQ